MCRSVGNAFGQRQFQCPYGVTVDPFSRNILVADYDTHRIFEFDNAVGSSSSASSTEGNFVRYALTGSDGCRGPCGLAVGPECGTLVVAESGDAVGSTVAGTSTPQTAGVATSWPANVKAYSMHVTDASANQELGKAGDQPIVERVWTFKTESAV